MKKTVVILLFLLMLVSFVGCNSEKKTEYYINNNKPLLNYQFNKKVLNKNETYSEIINLSVWLTETYEDIRLNFSDNAINSYIDKENLSKDCYEIIKEYEQLYYSDLETYSSEELKKILSISKLESNEKDMIIDEFNLDTLYKMGLAQEALDNKDYVKFLDYALGYESPNLNYNMQIRVFYSMYPEDIVKGIQQTLEESYVLEYELDTIKEFLVNIDKYEEFSDKIETIKSEYSVNTNYYKTSQNFSLTKGMNGTYTYKCQKKCDDSCKSCERCDKGEAFEDRYRCNFQYSASTEIGWIGCKQCGDVSFKEWNDWYDNALKS